MTGYRYLVEEKLGQDVCSWVKERRDAGMSLRGAAKEMTTALGFPDGIRMSHALLARWCPMLTSAPREARADQDTG